MAQFRIIEDAVKGFQVQKKRLFGRWKPYIHKMVEFDWYEPVWHKTQEEAKQEFEKLHYPPKKREQKIVSWWEV